MSGTKDCIECKQNQPARSRHSNNEYTADIEKSKLKIQSLF